MVAALARVVLLLAVSAAPAAAQRLPRTATPEHYDLAFTVDIPRARFEGTETIHVQIDAPTRRVVVNAAEIQFAAVTIDAAGVLQPKNYRAPMPPKGGAQLTDEQLAALAAYVWGLGHH